MINSLWLTIIGMDAGGYTTISAEARAALDKAKTIFGPERHLAMLPDLAAKTHIWPVPFSQGVDQLLSHRGEPTIMLVSGDPFWYGAGTSITRHLQRDEWHALAAYSSFSLAANKLGWALEAVRTIGLHAAPLTRLRPYFAPGSKIIATLRDGEAVSELADYLNSCGFGDSQLHILESLGGKDARNRQILATEAGQIEAEHPVMAGIDISGSGKVMSRASGLDDEWFEHDGQITKQAVRALTLSALAPVQGQLLWDLGAGSGSVAIEWLLSGPDMKASAVERNPERAASLRRNAHTLGVDWLNLIEADAGDVLAQLPKPDAVFIGGGLRRPLLDKLWEVIPVGTRIVANGVTLETDALLGEAQNQLGGSLMRIELSHMSAIGNLRGWKAAYPITQWVVQKS